MFATKDVEVLQFVLLGDSGAGKTSLMTQFSDHLFAFCTSKVNFLMIEKLEEYLRRCK